MILDNNNFWKFDSFTEGLKEFYTSKNFPLPGEAAQFKMAPISRLKKANYQEQIKKARKSAVFALFYRSGSNIDLLLIQRPSYEGVHSGQIGFPGGKKEVFDHSLLQTAYRETHEELGIHESQIELIGPLTDLYIPPSNFYVQPYLGFIKEKSISFLTNPYEVEELLHVPFKIFFKESTLDKRTFTRSDGQKAEYPCYNINDKIIWGATSMIISEIVSLTQTLHSEL